MAAEDGGHRHLEKIQMAISPQPVVRSTLCLVLGWGFRDGGSNDAIFDSNKFKMAPPSWIISNGHISATAHDLLIARSSLR